LFSIVYIKNSVNAQFSIMSGRVIEIMSCYFISTLNLRCVVKQISWCIFKLNINDISDILSIPAYNFHVDGSVYSITPSLWQFIGISY